jgi:hypothetical protein
MALFAPDVLESGWMDRRVEGGELKLEGRSLVEERLERRGGLDWTERTTPQVGFSSGGRCPVGWAGTLGAVLQGLALHRPEAQCPTVSLTSALGEGTAIFA